jgi:hypothetical protein
LKKQEIKRRRLGPGQNRTAGVGLAAVMSLVIEQMQQNFLQRLGVSLARRRLIRNLPPEIGVAIARDDPDQTGVFRDPGPKQFPAIFVEDRVEPVGMLP